MNVPYHYPFVNPPLPYAYDALEPYIDRKTMELHHDRHLQAYVNHLNDVLKDYPEYQNFSLEQLLLYPELLPSTIQTAVRNNAGGIYNHICYFSTLKPPASSADTENNSLLSRLAMQYGNIDSFLLAFTNAALSVFGSGYAWLTQDAGGLFKIITTANQDTPLTAGLYPVLPLDVWEHAYYLKHYNNRSAYIMDWMQLINWDAAAENISLQHRQY